MGHEAIIRLLLERGAVPDDQDLYLAAFARNAHQCLRLLLAHTPNVADTVETALSAPISTGDTEGCPALGPAPIPAGTSMIPLPRRLCSRTSRLFAELLELLLAHGADLDAPGPDGRSPYRLAMGQAKTDLAALLGQRGASDDATHIDRFLTACLRADRASAQRQVADQPGLLDRLTRAEQGGAIVQAAEAGNTAAVALMLDLGFPIDVRGGGDGSTPLHAAAYAGSAETVRLLLGLTPSPNDPKPPSPEVAQLLRAHGIGDQPSP